MSNFVGKFRGKVVNNVDPLRLGRLIALVPAVSETPLSWALPCTPYAGPDVGLFALPPIGANVWVEFEGGDPNYPIWTGCFWGEGEVPAEPAVPTTKVLKTETATFMIDDLTTAVTLELATPEGWVRLKLGSDGIGLSFNENQLKMTAQGIAAEIPPSAISIAPEGITLQSDGASAEIAPAGVRLQNAAAAIEVAPASISLENGAASIVLSPVSVNINDGALEVT